MQPIHTLLKYWGYRYMDVPFLTIAIPIYNAEPYLRDAIQSVVNQTYMNWQLHLINDGCTDGSLSIMREYEKKDMRIKVIDDGQNKGLIARLNQSVRLAEGRYYARMDADDIMYVTRIEEQVRFLEEHPDVDVCGTSIMTIDDKNNIVGSGYSEGPATGFVHPSVMGKTEWFLNNTYSDWALRAEDFELWTRAASKSKFYNIGKPLMFYREFGIPTFKKYYLSQHTLLRIFSRYKDYGKPFGWFLKNTILTIGKIVAYAIFSTIGKTDILVSMRRRTPVPNELQLTREDLGKAILPWGAYIP